ncbi:MAG: transglycosylase SLT domain-containing protein [Nitrospiraceae bacterium]|nr:transglycosylase SLT domain-containing protein [Nitrospiraceae bacterium]
MCNCKVNKALLKLILKKAKEKKLDNPRPLEIEKMGLKKGGVMRRCLLVVILVTSVFVHGARAADNGGFLSTLEDSPLAEKAVAKYVNLFTDTLRKPFALWLARSSQYTQAMRRILSENNIPGDIVFLSMIESGFNPYARSRASAVGPWQFMYATAKKYGLKINWWIDERRDPIKSTIAAAMYLNNLHDIFGSWGLAMAAYNAGEGAIQHAVRTERADSFWGLYRTESIKTETSNYVPKFLAASTIALNPKSHGFTGIDYRSRLSYDEVVIWRPLDLGVAARCADASVGTIRALNPELTRWCTPLDVKAYILRIPKNTLMTFLDNLGRLSPEQRLPLRSYTAGRRDTLYGIARRFGLPSVVIAELNNLNTRRSRRFIRRGQKILLPPRQYRSLCMVASR